MAHARAVIGALTSWLSGLASPWAYVVVGVLTLLEAAAFVGLVVPGETALLLGGVLAFQGRVSLLLMIAVAAAGAIIGDSVGYEIGRHVGPPLRRSRLGQRVGAERWARADRYLAAKGGRAVFFGRFVGILRALVPTIAGASRMPYRVFLPWNAAGGVIWAPCFVLAGYAAGSSYGLVERWVGRITLFLVVLAAVAVGVVALSRRLRSRVSRRAAVPSACEVGVVHMNPERLPTLAAGAVTRVPEERHGQGG
jgi:membrane protein DedA with SNARE-associated domain